MRPAAPLRRLAFVTACALTVLGCDKTVDGRPRHAISGKVTLDGKPLIEGTISFLPDEAARENPITASTGIRDGSYAIAAEKGLKPGSYQVWIVSDPQAATDAPPGEPPERHSPPKTKIPSRYNRQSTLKAVVTEEGTKTFDFELKSK